MERDFPCGLEARTSVIRNRTPAPAGVCLATENVQHCIRLVTLIRLKAEKLYF